MRMLALLLLSPLLAQAADFTTVSGCKETDYVEIDAPEVTVTTTPNREYSPKCLRVKAGTKVTIQSSGMHPLAAQADISGIKNPFSEGGVTQSLSEVGFYGYFCENHGDADGTGMAGSIQVVAARA